MQDKIKYVKCVFSDSLNEYVVYGFQVGLHHYTWNDDDCVYYRDDSDESWYSELPKESERVVYDALVSADASINKNMG